MTHGVCCATPVKGRVRVRVERRRGPSSSLFEIGKRRTERNNTTGVKEWRTFRREKWIREDSSITMQRDSTLRKIASRSKGYMTRHPPYFHALEARGGAKQ